MRKEAFYAGGCFWGVEYFMQQQEGVVNTTAGYSGGTKENPTYEEVCSGKTNHVETVKVDYDSEKISYENLTKLFFEIHDPTQKNGQGPDIGNQYLSVVFYQNEKEKKSAEKLIDALKSKGYDVATKVQKATHFWPAEQYHQNYYNKNGKFPYCHGYTKRF